MEFKVNNLDNCKKEVEFDLTYSDLTPHFDKALKKYRDKATIPGFRKGKAPISLLQKMYGDSIEYGAIEDIANEVFKEFLKNNSVNPIGEGLLTDINYDPKQTLRFKIQYEVKPEIENLKYKNIEVTKTIYPVDDHLIDEEIKYLRSKNAFYEEAEKITDDDFVVTLDVHKLDENGIEIIGEHVKDVKFYLNDSQINEELKHHLKSFKPNEEKTFSIKNNDKTERYRGKATKIEKVILPQLNADFFKKVSKKEIMSESEFRVLIKEDLESIYKNMSEQELKNNIMSELIKLNDIPVPDILVENIINNYIEDMKKQNPKRELPGDFNKEEYRKTRRADAILQVKWYLIRDKIIELEKIEVTDEDLNPIIKADSEKYGIEEKKIKKIYDNNPDVNYRILDDKVMDLLTKNAKLKETIHKHEHKIST
jgi:trigger factor